MSQSLASCHYSHFQALYQVSLKSVLYARAPSLSVSDGLIFKETDPLNVFSYKHEPIGAYELTCHPVIDVSLLLCQSTLS